jgi:hypothetical protein
MGWPRNADLRTFRGGRCALQGWGVRESAKSLAIGRETANLAPVLRFLTVEQVIAVYYRSIEERGGKPRAHDRNAPRFALLAYGLGAQRYVYTITNEIIIAYLHWRRQEPKPASNATIHAELALLAKATRRAGAEPAWKMPPLRVTHESSGRVLAFGARVAQSPGTLHHR